MFWKPASYSIILLHVSDICKTLKLILNLSWEINQFSFGFSSHFTFSQSPLRSVVKCQSTLPTPLPIPNIQEPQLSEMCTIIIKASWHLCDSCVRWREGHKSIFRLLYLGQYMQGQYLHQRHTNILSWEHRYNTIQETAAPVKRETNLLTQQ